MLRAPFAIVSIPEQQLPMQIRIDMGFTFILLLVFVALYINLRLEQTSVNRTKRADTYSAKNQ